LINLLIIQQDWAEIDEEITVPRKQYLIVVLPGLTATCDEPYVK